MCFVVLLILVRMLITGFYFVNYWIHEEALHWSTYVLYICSEAKCRLLCFVVLLILVRLLTMLITGFHFVNYWKIIQR